MLLPRRSVRTDQQAAVSARVHALLTPVRGGWTLPPEAAGPAEPPQRPAAPSSALGHSVLPAGGTEALTSAPLVETQQPLEPSRPVGAGPDRPVPAVATVLDRLRAGRLDPGRRAAAGLALLGLLACVVAGGLVLRGRPQEVALPVVERPGTPITGGARAVSGDAAPPAAAEVVVAVAGKVRQPGLVRLAPGSRVDDAVRAAGGLQPGASVGLLNLARKVVDGEQVLVGVQAPAGGPPAVGAVPGSAAGGAGRVDLNAASATDLDALPGIGPVLAQRIVDHRAQHGPFRSVDQLREVSGIGEAKYATLRDRVAV